MSTEIKLTSLPESVEEGTLMKWYKQEGEAVERDEKIADIETDKVVLEIPSQVAGTITSLHIKEGDTVGRNELLATLEEGASAGGDGKKEKKKDQEKEAGKQQASAEKDDEPADDAAAEKTDKSDRKAQKKPSNAKQKAAKKDSTSATEESSKDNQREAAPETDVKVSPAARKWIEEHDVDVSEIDGSGRGGRITKADVLAYINEDREPQGEEPSAPAEVQVDDELASMEHEDKAEREGRIQRRVPMSRLRARVADRLVQAQQTAAILTTFNEVDMKQVMDLRNQYKEAFLKKHEVKLGFMSFFIKASIEALRRYPVLNASLDERDIVYHGYYDIGVAVSSPRGLVVPIVKDADTLSFAELEEQVADFGSRAHRSELTLDELTGGTFTITNGGVFGSMLSTPILNPPQSAILGMHKIEQRPVAVDGEVVIRPVMYLALSYDHRLIDGRDAVQFLVTIKECLENPARLLLQI